MSESNPSRWSRPIVVLFLVTLWIPFVGMFFNTGEAGRPYERKTPLTWKGSDITAYMRDGFGFREDLITLQALLKIRVLGVSTSPYVLLGQEGWLFYTGDRSIQGSQGVYPFQPQELDAWLGWMQDNSKWMHDRGVAATFIFPPDKQTIYPEFLPEKYEKRGPSRLDQLERAISEHPEIPFVDVRRAVQNARDTGQTLYFRTDSHWNPAGAYVAYRAILPAIADSDLRPISYADIVTRRNDYVSDLNRMLGLGLVGKEEQDGIIPATSVPNTPPPGARKLILFGDSFSHLLIPFLARHFQVIYISPPKIDRALIERERPDFVLVEVVERKLNLPPP
jgi:alginate O-acetyltransferase complex protein AlgJ